VETPDDRSDDGDAAT